MDKIKNDLPISKKIVFLMVILFLILCMPINGIRALADEGEGTEPIDSPPIDNNSPSVTLRSCLEWYESNHPTPIQLYYEGECKKIVGYGGYLSWIALEDMKGRLTEGCEPAKKCEMSGTIGETTDEMIELESFEFLSPDAVSDLEAYDFSVYGFVRCTEPVLRIYPDKESMVVNEMIAIIVFLDCYDERMDLGVSLIEPVRLEVVSGPGELDLPELTPGELDMLRDSGYSLDQDNIIMTNFIEEEVAMLYATDVGTIEIKATYESCRGDAYKSTITETAIVDVGQKEAKFSGTIFFNRNLEWDKEQPDATISKRWKGNLEERATLQVTLKYTNTYQGEDYYKVEDASGTYNYSYDSKEEYRGQESGGKYTITHSAHDSGNLERSHIYCLLLHDPEKKKYAFYFNFSSPEKDGTTTWDFGTDVITVILPWGISVGEHEYEENTDGRIFTGSWEIPGKNIKGESTDVLGTYAFVGLTGAHASWTFVKP